MRSRPFFIVQPTAGMCRFCGKLRKEVRALLGSSGEDELAICDECVDLAGQLVAQKRNVGAPRANAVVDKSEREVQPEPRCSFCDARKSEVDALVAAAHGYVCSACIDDAAALVAALPRRSRRDLVVGFVTCDAGSCGFCGKARHEVKALLGTKMHQNAICDECVEQYGAMVARARPARRARTPDVAESPTVDDQLAAIVTRFREGPLADDEAAYNELRPKAANFTLPRTYDRFRCSFCDVHWRDVELIRTWRALICYACLTDALTVVQGGAETAVKGVDDLLREHAAKPISTRQILERVLELATPENVDEVMRALPDEMREVVVAYVQETFASGVEVDHVGNRARSRERNDVLCDWVRRVGRFHLPRRADEPSIDEIRARLDPRLDPQSRFQMLRSEPFGILRYVRVQI